MSRWAALHACNAPKQRTHKNKREQTHALTNANTPSHRPCTQTNTKNKIAHTTTQTCTYTHVSSKINMLAGRNMTAEGCINGQHRTGGNASERDSGGPPPPPPHLPVVTPTPLITAFSPRGRDNRGNPHPVARKCHSFMTMKCNAASIN